MTLKDMACGVCDATVTRDSSTDTDHLVMISDRGCGLDIPHELLSRHISTDTRTLISMRDNFSTTTPAVAVVQLDAETQSVSIVQHDVSSNTPTTPEQKHISIQVRPFSTG
jgi:hypothetical protein